MERAVAPPADLAAAEGIERRHRFRVYAVLAPLTILLILWVWVFYGQQPLKGGPNGERYGADYAMYATAAQLMQQGRNPYDQPLLYRTERAKLERLGLKIVHPELVVRVGNPPWFFWMLRPLDGLPFQPVAAVWSLGLYVLSGAGLLASLRYLGWTRWRWRYSTDTRSQPESC